MEIFISVLIGSVLFALIVAILMWKSEVMDFIILVFLSLMCIAAMSSLVYLLVFDK